MNRSAQKRLAEIANEPFEHLDGVDLTWYAIGRIDAMQNHINKLQSELAELRKDNKCASCTNRGKDDGLTQETYCDSCIYAEPWRKDNYNAMKEVK